MLEIAGIALTGIGVIFTGWQLYLQYNKTKLKSNPRSYLSGSSLSDEKIEIDHTSNNTFIDLEYYFNLVLRSCNVIDLGGLPEGDRGIVSRKFTLREFYIPLRLVRIKNELEDLVDDQEKWKEFDYLAADGINPTTANDVDDNTKIQVDDIQIELKEENSFGRIFEANKRLVILGDPGSGKSTLARWITSAMILKWKNEYKTFKFPDSEAVPNVNYIPILIRCREILQDNQPRSLADIVKFSMRMKELDEVAINNLYDHFREKIEQGEVLLIIDGLDEIRNTSNRARLARQLHEFSITHPQTPIIITSRIVGYREMNYKLRNGFTHTKIDVLSRKDKDSFARKWCNATSREENKEEAIQDLINAIHSSPSIERLTNNALQLTILALVKRKMRSLPRRRDALYRECIQTLLNWRADVDEPLEWREVVPQLEYIAYYMCQYDLTRLDADKITELLHQVRDKYPTIAIKKYDPGEFLQLIERRTSILVECGYTVIKGREISVYEFRHLTFQEYLAGLALVDGKVPDFDPECTVYERISPLLEELEKESQQVRSWMVSDESIIASKWHEPLKLCVASCNSREASNVLLGMISHESSSSMKGIARARAIMAASCLAEEPDISLELGKKILNKVIDSLEESDVFDFKANTSLDKVADELIHSEVWKNEFANCVKYRFTESTGMPRRKIGMLYLYIKHYLKSENILESIDAAYISSDDNHIIDILFELSHEIIFRIDELHQNNHDFNELFTFLGKLLDCTESTLSATTRTLYLALYECIKKGVIIDNKDSLTNDLKTIISDHNTPIDIVYYSILCIGELYSTQNYRTHYLFSWAEEADGLNKRKEKDTSNALTTIIPREIVYYVNQWLTNKEFIVRKNTALVLAKTETKSDQAVTAMLELLFENKTAISDIEEATLYVGLYGNEQTAKILLESLYSSDDIIKRYSVIALFGIKRRNNLDFIQTMPELKNPEIMNLAYRLLDLQATDKYSNDFSYVDFLIRNSRTPIHLVRGRDSTRMECYFFLMCSHRNLDKLLETSKDGNQDLTSYGRVVASAYGTEVSDQIRALMRDKYNFDADKLTSIV